LTLWERMEKVAEKLERLAHHDFTMSLKSNLNADHQLLLYNQGCVYQNTAREIRNALQEHAMKEGAVEEQAEYGERRAICPLMSKLNPDKFGEVQPVFCLDKCCAWWTGTECAVVAIAKRGRGVDVMIKPPAVPGL